MLSNCRWCLTDLYGRTVVRPFFIYQRERQNGLCFTQNSQNSQNPCGVECPTQAQTFTDNVFKFINAITQIKRFAVKDENLWNLFNLLIFNLSTRLYGVYRITMEQNSV